MNLATSIQYLKGVGEKRAATLRRLGITTLGELLAHLPRTYEDWQTITPIAAAQPGQLCCVRAIVDHAPSEHRIRGGLILYKTRVTDGSGVLGITMFNTGYLAGQLKEGQEYLFYGRLSDNLLACEMNSPQIAPSDEARLRPVYPLTEGMSSRVLEGLVATALAQVGAQVKEFLPEQLLGEHDLMPRLAALQAIHRPQTLEQAQQARQRLAFNELFTLQLGLRLLKLGRTQTQAIALPPTDFLSTLPFTPTGAQSKAVQEAARDMATTQPMHRLLQGDVGSGKTAVAAALMHQAAQAGAQAAMLAPTELLARQHHATLQKLGLDCTLLIGSTPAAQKKKLKSALEDGSQLLVVGTHALLQHDVNFAKLALLVVDEQHRFGVDQRNRLSTVNCPLSTVPHTLVMSATPIPRSLAMMIFGDMDITVLDELPPGRTAIETYAVHEGLRERAYHYVKKHLDAGQQGYIVCPRVEENESRDLASAKKFYEQLAQGQFAGYRLGLLHGKLPAKQKDAVMRDFAAGDIQLLIATTVVEVGIDVPNAVIMVIENAERFGLSQLHQLRGRVGRGGGKSTCILISNAENEEAQARFAIMKESGDGFAIARRDLELRGPGEFFGQRQHGLPPFKIADIVADHDLLAQTRAAAEGIFAKDPTLTLEEHQPMRRACERFFDKADEDIAKR
ncbi:MAG: ATP-dependent DNA helicase RecG [Oscillospiraceae bacterium]|nr:ATP-dependent DNA helicase RecG [Oscillospiraceae bacterium]